MVEGISVLQFVQQSEHLMIFSADTANMLMLFCGLELQLMFSLMDRVPDGITPMLHDLEAHIVSQGLADMIAAAESITQVSYLPLACQFILPRAHIYETFCCPGVSVLAEYMVTSVYPLHF